VRLRQDGRRKGADKSEWSPEARNGLQVTAGLGFRRDTRGFRLALQFFLFDPGLPGLSGRRVLARKGNGHDVRVRDLHHARLSLGKELQERRLCRRVAIEYVPIAL